MSNKFENFETEQVTQLTTKLNANYDTLTMFNFFDTSRFYLNQRYTYLNQTSNQTVTNTMLVGNKPNMLSNNASHSHLKLNILKSYFVRNFNNNLSLYSSHYFSEKLNSNEKLSSLSYTTGKSNIFVTSPFNDLLQFFDLQVLSTINSSISSTSQPQKLFLNQNFSFKTSFKS